MAICTEPVWFWFRICGRIIFRVLADFYLYVPSDAEQNGENPRRISFVTVPSNKSQPGGNFPGIGKSSRIPCTWPLPSPSHQEGWPKDVVQNASDFWNYTLIGRSKIPNQRTRCDLKVLYKNTYRIALGTLYHTFSYRHLFRNKSIVRDTHLFITLTTLRNKSIVRNIHTFLSQRVTTSPSFGT